MRSATGGLAAVVLISAAVMTAAPVAVVVTGLALLLVPGLRRFPWARALRMWWRMKWFYLSLALFFGLWPVDGGTASGLVEAATRIAALMLVVLAVVWLTDRHPREELVAALGRALGGRPGSRVGAGQRFARRLFLALEHFERDRPGLEGRRAGLGGSRRVRMAAVREWLVGRLAAALDAGDGPASDPPETGEGKVEEKGREWPGAAGRGLETGWLMLVALVALGLQWAAGLQGI
ncbi:hypothetical protein [Thioalkalivibrio sp. ALJ24]|uniref:hypothetical protein n=1 Tax=Thioalkalivibrio sp. ALJ24 TaxID=545276 RepID=UPI000374AAF2|nr:hypothetical protein [Thioalkalivibrio sp. ALJ24]